jgi:hypothetical protein
MALGDLIPTHVKDAIELREPYQEFWQAFRASLRGVVVKPDSLRLRLEKEKDGETIRIVFLDGPMRILGVKSPTRGGDAADIFFSSEHVVCRVESEDGPAWRVLRSEIDLLYLNALENKVAKRALEVPELSYAYAGYRFVSDAGNSLRPHFPDCYAVHKLDPIKETSVARLYVRTTREETWRGKYLADQPFFLTAPMDLTALIYGFLHCHWQGVVVRGWPSSFKRCLAKLPTFSLRQQQRSTHESWWDHHQASAPPPSPPATPTGFTLSAEARNAGWSVCIRGHERVEEPHVTITRGDGRDGRTWRYSLRTGVLLEGSEDDVREDVLTAIRNHHNGWEGLWTERYGSEHQGNNPVRRPPPRDG